MGLQGRVGLQRPVGRINPPLGYQPNIVLIQTDDQDVELGGMMPMPKTRRLLGEGGVTHSKWYVGTPVCCPSRTETLSGRFHHNMRDGYGPEWNISGCGDEHVGQAHRCGCMRMNCSATMESTHYGNYLQGAGYTTAYYGKYLNPPAMDPYCHNRSTPVPGWHSFYGMCKTAYYDLDWVDSSGNLVHTGSLPSEYSTSIIGNLTVKFIQQHAAPHRTPHDGAFNATRAPFFVSAATRAPHGPATPAPWYAGKFAPGLHAPRTAAYNAVGSGHVPWLADQRRVHHTSLLKSKERIIWIRDVFCSQHLWCRGGKSRFESSTTKFKPHLAYDWSCRPFSASEESTFDATFTDRWRTLLSVDDLVEAVVKALDAAGVLNETFIFYTSDHGYHLGALRLGECHFAERHCPACNRFFWFLQCARSLRCTASHPPTSSSDAPYMCTTACRSWQEPLLRV